MDMKNAKIVLVEDDQILSKVLREELEDAGFSVTQAFDGEQGVETVQSVMPDLVLLDIMMPKMNGFEALRVLRASPATETIPVIILTMLGKDEDVKQGLQLGAKDYIVKSQHAVAEITEKVKDFFKMEAHPRQHELKREVKEPEEQEEEKIPREKTRD
ncbi:MAG: response regulator [Candidatus Taylorbacteria bacterium]|nr:response regulator [Candidatus Taylorbacteria bacterium]